MQHKSWPFGEKQTRKVNVFWQQILITCRATTPKLLFTTYPDYLASHINHKLFSDHNSWTIAELQNIHSWWRALSYLFPKFTAPNGQSAALNTCLESIHVTAYMHTWRNLPLLRGGQISAHIHPKKSQYRLYSDCANTLCECNKDLTWQKKKRFWQSHMIGFIPFKNELQKQCQQP